MGVRTAVGFVIGLIAVLGINFIPFEMLYYGDFSGESAMAFYAAENLVTVGFATAFVLLFAPVREKNPDYERRDELLKKHPAFPIDRFREKKEILKLYLVFSLGFTAASLIFLTAFIAIVLKTEIQFSEILGGMAWLSAFLLIQYIGDLIGLRPFTLAKAEALLKQSMGRVALLFLAVFAGIFLALLVDRWFVFPFIALKTLVDIGGLIGIFTRSER
ncbi:MAG: DUF6498-containing protein [Pyrinomonadaceae bacterium]